MALRSSKDAEGRAAMPRLLPERVEAFAAKVRGGVSVVLPRKGRYRHFKGGEYEVHRQIARHSETDEPLVIYRALYPCPDTPNGEGIWARPLSSWNAPAAVEGKAVPRFAPDFADEAPLPEPPPEEAVFAAPPPEMPEIPPPLPRPPARSPAKRPKPC